MAGWKETHRWPRSTVSCQTLYHRDKPGGDKACANMALRTRPEISSRSRLPSGTGKRLWSMRRGVSGR